MNEQQEKLFSALKAIPPDDYNEWITAGMALKNEGFPVTMWDEWSRSSTKYKPGLCEKKWNGFNQTTGDPVTLGTIYHFAKKHGWYWSGSYNVSNNIPFGWDDPIGGDCEGLSSRKNSEYVLPESFDPAGELVKYLETLFKPDDIIRYVTTDAYSDKKDRKWKPRNGVFHRKAGEITSSIKKNPDKLEATFGHCQPGAGAWIGFNPLDGAGTSNENVTAFRYALVESDNMSLGDQNAAFRKLELPIACLVYSGGKSIHAIVHIDAKNYEEYVERVRYLYAYLEKNGVTIDKQNRNPSRLSRMPGVARGDKRQQLIDTNIGKRSWSEWYESVTQKPSEPEKSQEQRKKFIAKTASSFNDFKASFLWKPYIPMHEITALFSAGGNGKTMFLAGVVSYLSAGKALPGGVQMEPVKSLYISSEDSGEILRSRFKCSGANLDNIAILDCSASVGLTYNHMDDFEGLIMDNGAKLVCIDPWFAFLGDSTDINRINLVRPIFQKITKLAKDCDCAIVLVSHESKKTQESANNGALGSVDFINASRSAIKCIPSDEPGEENIKICVHTKSNYASLGKSICFRVKTDEQDNAGLEWAGFSEINKNTLEAAARYHKTPSQIKANRSDEQELIEELCNAIEKCAVPGKVVNISYDQFKDDFGASIFGSYQPKRALDQFGVVSRLSFEGIQLVTGKKVKYQDKVLNGFSIMQGKDDDSTAPVDEFEQLQVDETEIPQQFYQPAEKSKVGESR